MKWLNPLILSALLTGCAGTVAPKLPVSKVASFDGNAQTSGLIAFDATGNGILTSHAHDRYNALAGLYGSKFQPPLKIDAGITPTTTNTFLIDGEHLVDFATMNGWKKSGK